jgi:hypothetical protein
MHGPLRRCRYVYVFNDSLHAHFTQSSHFAIVPTNSQLLLKVKPLKMSVFRVYLKFYIQER